MAIRLSTVKKLDGIRSWSLQARTTCPGSIDSNGELVPVCQGCYAVSGNYRFPSVKEPRLENQEDWKRDDWVQDMVRALDADRYFRWFDSGDMYALPLAEKILAVMKQTPWCKHWLPTRMAKFPKFANVIAEMKALPNVSVRFSSDSIDGQFEPGIHGSTVFSDKLPAGTVECKAYEHGGKCNGCRQCWNKDIPVIAYHAHGRDMMKVIQIKKVA